MIIPHKNLDKDVLVRIVEDFVTRDGTDYGELEVSMEAKSQQLLSQICSEQVYIVFDPATESLSLLGAEEAQTLLNNE